MTVEGLDEKTDPKQAPWSSTKLSKINLSRSTSSSASLFSRASCA